MEISIIVPTYNRADSLNSTLTSIFRLSNLADAEVIVVDNGSTDRTAEVCKSFTHNEPALQYFYDAEPGLLTGRHLGASVSKGHVLCFLDDDVELSASWIDGVRDAFKDPAVQLATGPCLPNYETEPPEWLAFFWQKLKDGGKFCSGLSLLDFGNDARFIDPNYVWGLNFCIRKTALNALGGFHPDSIPAQFQMFQGDGETGLTMKANTHNYKAFYHPQIKLHHYVPSQRLTIEYFKKRAFYQGVCNSFTSLRQLNTHNELRVAEEPSKRMTYLLKSGIHTLKLYKMRLHQLLYTPPKIKAILDLLALTEKEGFEFHQQAFRDNVKVREWVLNKDYWNYKLPV